MTHRGCGGTWQPADVVVREWEPPHTSHVVPGLVCDTCHAEQLERAPKLAAA